MLYPHDITLKDLTVSLSVYLPDYNFTFPSFDHFFCNEYLKLSIDKCDISGNIDHLLWKNVKMWNSVYNSGLFKNIKW